MRGNKKKLKRDDAPTPDALKSFVNDTRPRSVWASRVHAPGEVSGDVPSRARRGCVACGADVNLSNICHLACLIPVSRFAKRNLPMFERKCSSRPRTCAAAARSSHHTPTLSLSGIGGSAGLSRAAGAQVRNMTSMARVVAKPAHRKNNC